MLPRQIRALVFQVAETYIDGAIADGRCRFLLGRVQPQFALGGGRWCRHLGEEVCVCSEKLVPLASTHKVFWCVDI